MSMAQAADRLGRRKVLGLLSVGAVAVGSSIVQVRTASRELPAPNPPAPSKPAPPPDPWALVAPLEAGAMLGTVRLIGLSGITGTATVDIEFETEEKARFCARLCRRDNAPGAPTPIARTRDYDLFLSNGGNGEKPTNEHHGVTVMALGAVVRQNEPALERLPLSTMRQRWQQLALGMPGTLKSRTT